MPKKTDRNHLLIMLAFRRFGASLQSLHAVGGGCPDLMVGYKGRTLAVEVKDGAKPPSRRKLTKAQQEWFANWEGEVHICESVDDVPGILGVASAEVGTE